MRKIDSKLLRYTLLIISMLMLAVGMVRLGMASFNAYVYGPHLNENSVSASEYLSEKPSSNSVYQERSLVEKYSSPAYMLWSGEEPKIGVTVTDLTVTLRHSVKYYTRVDGEYVFDFEIPAGTEVYAISPWNPLEVGYGFVSTPTIDKGWRYAKAFMTVEEYESGTYTRAYRYVKLDDLKPIAKEAYNTNPFYRLYADSLNYSELWFKHAGMLLYVDNAEYLSGNCYLPDLHHDTGDTLALVLLIFGFILLVGSLIAFTARRRSDGKGVIRFGRGALRIFASKLFLLILIIPIALLTYRMVVIGSYNRAISEYYSENEDVSEEYRNHSDVRDIDFNALNEYGFYYTKSYPGEMIEVRLPITVSYYSSTADKSPALTIPKGTSVYISTSTAIAKGYGASSYPSYEKGWRYAAPFVIADGSQWDEKLIADSDMYYVKTSELVSVVETMYRDKKSLQDTFDKQQKYDGKYIEYTGDEKSFAKYYVLQIDRSLEAGGYYLSPDLGYEYMDTVNVKLLYIIGGLVIIHITAKLAVVRYQAKEL